MREGAGQLLRWLLAAPTLPDFAALSPATAIAHALYTVHASEEMPVGIVVDPATHEILERACLGCWNTGRQAFFSLPVDVDPEVVGWSVQVRSAPGRWNSSASSRFAH